MPDFTIDDFEIERPDDEFAYTAKSGRRYVFADPKALKGRDLLRLNFQDPEETLLILLGDDYDEFMDEDEVDGYLIDPLMERWAKQYKLPVDMGKGRGSRRPSAGSGKR
ncbi:hypothetical protein [Kineococcus radiotolerans]|uniref:Uncharacterized protein n=1 Tax=Kineococcus radiotolerans (strain ATCC BAA-149 / DSM 14245 / SRS30216) TaxID=266940 RepID=A6W8Q9_KINRD|nr:hypothetical protein [Kineococcus radiotolerans]ABS03198.1 hypothetical protein Krad_1712 [Kineococcus radiotolerans SRS30216 = ATCC BAA-149]